MRPISEEAHLIGQVLYAPLLSANYQDEGKFSFGMFCIILCGIALVFSNWKFFSYAKLKPQHYLWAIQMWANCLFMFQLSLVIDKRINRLQMVIAIFHDAFELYMTYWNFLYLRGYLRAPEKNFVHKSISTGDFIGLWLYSIIALFIILGQLFVVILIEDLRYGIYAFYLILLGDTFFMGTGVIVYISRVREKVNPFKSSNFGPFIAILNHMVFASNNVLTCREKGFTAYIANFTNLFSILAVSWTVWENSKELREHPGDTTDHEHPRVDNNLPSDFHFL